MNPHETLFLSFVDTPVWLGLGSLRFSEASLMCVALDLRPQLSFYTNPAPSCQLG